MHETPDQIRRKGLVALRRDLGRAGMIRFLQQFETGQGDYAKERHAWVDATSLDEIHRIVGNDRKKSPRRRRRKKT